MRATKRVMMRGGDSGDDHVIDGRGCPFCFFSCFFVFFLLKLKWVARHPNQTDLSLRFEFLERRDTLVDDHRYARRKLWIMDLERVDLFQTEPAQRIETRLVGLLVTKVEHAHRVLVIAANLGVDVVGRARHPLESIAEHPLRATLPVPVRRVDHIHPSLEHSEDEFSRLHTQLRRRNRVQAVDGQNGRQNGACVAYGEHVVEAAVVSLDALAWSRSCVSSCWNQMSSSAPLPACARGYHRRTL